MPVLRSSRKRALMVLIFGFLGLTLLIVYLLTRGNLLRTINKVKS